VKIRAGYDIAFQCPYAVPMVLMLTTHPSRDGDILSDQLMRFSPRVDARDFFDPYGNICTRLVAPPGLLEVRSEFLVEDSGLPDEVRPAARQWDVADLPGDVLPFLLASRYCDTERLSNLAWSLFGGIQGGWQRAQAICDYAHDRIRVWLPSRSRRPDRLGRTFGTPRRLPGLRTSCRNAFPMHEYSGAVLHGLPRRHRRSCRPAPMDFSAWYEAFLDGRWFTFDERHNRPRIRRIVIARGRDAADVAISTAFGPAQLVRFKVITEELEDVSGNSALKEAA
jgi:transglutaminase-like putative cysteine protease